MTDGDSVTINNLRNSANGTFVTSDDYLLLTTLGVAVGPASLWRTNIWPRDVVLAMRGRVPAVSGPADRICPPPRESERQQNQPHPQSARPHNSSRERHRQNL